MDKTCCRSKHFFRNTWRFSGVIYGLRWFGIIVFPFFIHFFGVNYGKGKKFLLWKFRSSLPFVFKKKQRLSAKLLRFLQPSGIFRFVCLRKRHVCCIKKVHLLDIFVLLLVEIVFSRFMARQFLLFIKRIYSTTSFARIKTRNFFHEWSGGE